MGDLIDKQKVIDICNRAIDLLDGQLGTGAMTAVRDWVVNLPSIQPEIIYCKDCKYYHLYVLFGRSQGMCERLCDYDSSSARLTEGDDFCSHAEMRKQ